MAVGRRRQNREQDKTLTAWVKSAFKDLEKENGRLVNRLGLSLQERRSSASMTRLRAEGQASSVMIGSPSERMTYLAVNNNSGPCVLSI